MLVSFVLGGYYVVQLKIARFRTFSHDSTRDFGVEGFGVVKTCGEIYV